MPKRPPDTARDWHDWSWWQLRGPLPPRALQPWLRETGSLTDRLRRYSGDRVRVEVLRQGVGVPRLDELSALDCPPRSRALIREVLLHAGAEPAFFGRTVIPLADLQGRLGHLRYWGSASIGSYLFDQPSLERGELHFCLVAPGQSGGREIESRGRALWGRRSRFGLYRGRILVSEYFLPDFPHLNADSE